MPSKRSLNQFVADKSRAGDFDSAGEFTVSTDRALEKLRVHSLENPSDWVLKMVQAAVAGHASEVRFTQFRNRVKVEFALPQPLERERLAQAWLSPKLGQQGEFLSELLIGLRPFLLSQRLLFRLGKDELLEWVGEELRSSQRSKELWHRHTSFAVVVERRPENRSWLRFRRAGVDAAEAVALQERARFSPIPVFLDGRRVKPLGRDFVHCANLGKTELVRRHPLALGSLTPEEYQESSFLGEPTLAGARPLKGRALENTIAFANWPVEANSKNCCHFFFVYGWREDFSDGPTPNSKRSTYPDSFTAHLTRLGVVVGERTAKDMPLGGYVQVALDGARTDLTGLSIQFAGNERARLSGHLVRLAPVLRKLKCTLDRYSPSLTDVLIGDVPTLGGLAGLVGGGFGLMGAPLLGAAVGGFFLVYSLTDTGHEELRIFASQAVKDMLTALENPIKWHS